MSPAQHGFLRHRALGTEAVYRILDASGPTVEVEVVRAPGLDAGARLTFTREAAQAMDRLATAVAGAPTAARLSRLHPGPRSERA